jgi:hypothetical protein
LNSVLYVNSNVDDWYNKNNFFSSLKEKLTINVQEVHYIEDLKLKIRKVNFPLNINEIAFAKNMKTARNILKREKSFLAPKTYRMLDYNYFTEFQKDLIGLGVLSSIKLFLRTNKKSLKNSAIVLYDAAEPINRNIIKLLAKSAKFLILLSDNISRTKKLSDYITSNYGISPVVTADINYSLKIADAVILSKEIIIDKKIPVWCFNNLYVPKLKNGIYINDFSFNVPWSTEQYPAELLGAILGQMQEKDAEKALKTNEIFLDKIKFNDKVIEFT